MPLLGDRSSKPVNVLPSASTALSIRHLKGVALCNEPPADTSTLSVPIPSSTKVGFRVMPLLTASFATNPTCPPLRSTIAPTCLEWKLLLIPGGKLPANSSLKFSLSASWTFPASENTVMGSLCQKPPDWMLILSIGMKALVGRMTSGANVPDAGRLTAAPAELALISR